jgi:hypothetical protein
MSFSKAKAPILFCFSKKREIKIEKLAIARFRTLISLANAREIKIEKKKVLECHKTIFLLMSYRYSSNDYKKEDPMDHLVRFCGSSNEARHNSSNYHLPSSSNSSYSSNSFTFSSNSGHSDILVGTNGPCWDRMYYSSTSVANIYG